jgi:ABC-type sugar transport system substrate-binding protein
MSNGIKRIKTALIILTALIFVATTLGLAEAGTFQIPAKGNKKIKIAVLDWYSGIEVAALANNNYKRLAKERGWDIQIFDVLADPSKVQGTMQNIITAGYDGIIVNWTDFKYYDQMVLKAYKAGIPLQGIACGNNVPGVISQGIAPDMGTAALSSMYLVSKLRAGDKILVYLFPSDATSMARLNTAKVAFQHYRMKIHQEIHFNGTGDSVQHCYESVKNAILADKNKEIKGIWTPWEGWGVMAAKAAQDMKRPDIVSVTIDDSPSTYSDIRNLPNLAGTSGTNWDNKEWTGRLFRNFDKIFAGQPFQDGEIWFSMPNLVTKDNLPPPGYYYNPCGYKGHPPDFKVK